jgi:hypothetical protein
MIFGTPPIITSGLTTHLDAANVNSYSRTGATWTDMSGNGNNSSLINSPTFDPTNQGCIQFNGVNQYTSVPISTTVGSINFWFYYNAGTKTKTVMGNSSTNVMYIAGAGGFMHWWNGSGDYSFGAWPAGAGDTSQWINICATYTSAASNKLYANGVLSAATTTYTLNKATPYYVAGTILNYQNCKFALISTYNRELSDQEVNQNYNALKNRFGLT